MPDAESELFAAIAKLETMIHTLDIMTRDAEDDAQTILLFMVDHLRPIHEKLTDEFDKLEKQRLHAV